MNNSHNHFIYRGFRKTIVLMLGLMLGSTLAFAHEREHCDHRQRYSHTHHSDRYDDDDYYERRRHRRAYKRRAHFKIPRHIKNRRHYRDYYYDRHYHRGHNHYHQIYRFPVYGRQGVSYRAYDYCEGRLFATGHFTIHGPRFSLSLGF